MTDERRQVTLSKAHRETPAGRELIDLLTELSADGNVSREEMERLRAWLEVDHGVDFPALPFLHETIEQISLDGEVTEDELDLLALAIERVLPKDIRLAATARRKQLREARRVAQRETQRQTMIAARVERKASRDAARVRAGLLYRAEWPVRGAFRSAERREACERLIDGDTVKLEREPDSPHDSNAILILGHDDGELGYVPRDEARTVAPLLDAGAEADVIVCRLWETPEGQVVPIVLAKVRRGDADPSVAKGAKVKSSPFCAEQIQDEAVKCRHCGESFTTDAARWKIFCIQLNALSPHEREGALAKLTPKQRGFVKLPGGALGLVGTPREQISTLRQLRSPLFAIAGLFLISLLLSVFLSQADRSKPKQAVRPLIDRQFAPTEKEFAARLSRNYAGSIDLFQLNDDGSLYVNWTSTKCAYLDAEVVDLALSIGRTQKGLFSFDLKCRRTCEGNFTDFTVGADVIDDYLSGAINDPQLYQRTRPGR